MLRCMGFNKKWISLIMVCVKSFTYSILVGGEPKGLIIPTSPPPPPIFLLCSEGLHSLISQAARNGDMWGFSISQRSLRLTYLFFANDSLLLCMSTQNEYQKIMNILDTYESIFMTYKSTKKKPPCYLASPPVMEEERRQASTS